VGTVAHDGPARTTANHLGRGNTARIRAHDRNDDRTALSLFAGIVRRLSAHPRADDGKFPILLAVFPVADYYPLKQAALVHNPIAYIPAPSSVSGAGVTLVMQLTNPVVSPRETRADWLCETVLAGQHPVLADWSGWWRVALRRVYLRRPARSAG